MKENKSVVLSNVVVPARLACFASKSEKRNTMGFTRNCHPKFISGSTPLVIIQNKEEMLKQVQHDNRRGFTLIELLIVVLIIGILSAVAVPQYKKAIRNVQYKKMLPTLDHVVKQQKIYYLEHGSYATSFAQLGMEFPTSQTCYSPSATDKVKVDNYCLSLVVGDYVRVAGLPENLTGLPTYNTALSGYAFALTGYKVYGSSLEPGLYCSGSGTDDKHCTGARAGGQYNMNFYFMK